MILSIILMIFNYNHYKMNTFGSKLKELRIERGLTQKQLSQKLGCAQSAVYYWEADKQEPSISSLKKICEIFEVSADYMLNIDDGFGKF